MLEMERLTVLDIYWKLLDWRMLFSLAGRVFVHRDHSWDAIVLDLGETQALFEWTGIRSNPFSSLGANNLDFALFTIHLYAD